MGMLLPQAETLSLFINDKGGEAWTQTSDGCGPHKLNSSGGERRGVFLSAGLAPLPGYDGVLSTGLASSPSFPAIDDPPPQPACSKKYEKVEDSDVALSPASQPWMDIYLRV